MIDFAATKTHISRHKIYNNAQTLCTSTKSQQNLLLVSC